jgi:hypothetical protein
LPDKSTSLPNILAVVAHLKKAGYKVGRQTVYNHRHEGKIRPGKDGKFPLSAVEKYAAIHLQHLGAPPPEAASGLDSSQRNKVDAETRKALAQAEHWELKTKTLSGDLVPRDLFERELAARAAVLKSDLSNFARSEPLAIITIVKGDPARAPELEAYMISAVERALARYAEKREFTVPTDPTAPASPEDPADE